ncbi:helix-turn-helix transcriptional regulator [Vulcanisaeta sp. JCM 14467]|uniref:helix-turn-helix transcriptional regulator n=1 Tax=Vulcanisaeta sp. JCM 14467 TaxID=1295370 RepID=UPI0006D10567|nr:winged helix-turn-helix transcriptional regulator [Vulcanisaeta sp. JCM 14467]
MVLTAIITILIYLLGNGSLVSINVTTMQSTALLNITLPVKPLEPTGPIVVQNSSGSAIPAILIGNHLIIPVFGNGSFIIKYIPYVAQTPSGYLVINVSSPYTVNLFVGNNVLITELPISSIVNFTKVSNGIILQIAPGNYSIGFMPELSVTTVTNKTTTMPTSVSNTSTTTAITNTSTTSEITKTSPNLGLTPYYVVFIVIAAVAAILAYSFVTRHRGAEASPVIVEGLNPTDREVLKALIDMGGEAYQADLQRRLNIPKATLWRAIRRLENSGYVQVIKEGRVNKIKLVKKPKLD